MPTALDLIAYDYHRRLKAAGIPPGPAGRTPEQQQAAALEFWAAKSQVTLDAGSLDQSAVEQ
jgi:hypothetical protein